MIAGIEQRHFTARHGTRIGTFGHGFCTVMGSRRLGGAISIVRQIIDLEIFPTVGEARLSTIDVPTVVTGEDLMTPLSKLECPAFLVDETRRLLARVPGWEPKS